jgi:hypothetical protein
MYSATRAVAASSPRVCGVILIQARHDPSLALFSIHNLDQSVIKKLGFVYTDRHFNLPEENQS